ncbi:hypothetical protein [Peromfec virus RodF8_53]|uniref:Uncharacterized protein n=1 Tax=Peromfec virus RodF8_53 TaxID=2929382 RepID=A0A976N1P3_9VIRU|nr:hypothetical protein [Peromfec virus RodF8_53]
MDYSIKVSELFLLKAVLRRFCRLNFCTNSFTRSLMDLFDRIVVDVRENGHLCCVDYFNI